MAKHLVVSAEKTNRGCFELYGWSSVNKRGIYEVEFDGRLREAKVITEEQYLRDFGEWDMPICKERIRKVTRSKECQYTF